jgi:hypothetical protein
MRRANVSLHAAPALGALLLAAACAAPRTQAAAGDSGTSNAVTAESAAFSLARGACHGSCPIYSVRLFEDGRVHFTGTRFVRVMGADSSRIDRKAIDALHSAFNQRQFDAVPGVIEYGGATCGSYVADLSTVTISARTARGTHTVRYDEGCTAHPAMLDSLSRMLDSVSGTARWTTPERP